MFPKETRILVVDDFSTMRKIVRKVLNELGYEQVEEADDGASALPMIQEGANKGKNFGLVISDWSMPQMAGIDLLRHCKADPRLKVIPFILVTSDSDQKNSVEAADSGVSDCIVKPFNAGTLKAKLEKVYARQMAAVMAKAS